jgi:hypothetical protein
MQQVIPVLHDQTGVDRHADMLLECRIGLRLLEGMQLPVLEVAQPGSKSPARQGKQTKDMIASAPPVSVKCSWISSTVSWSNRPSSTYGASLSVALIGRMLK